MGRSLWFILHLSQERAVAFFLKEPKDGDPDRLANFFMQNSEGGIIDTNIFSDPAHTLGELRIKGLLRKVFLEDSKALGKRNSFKGNLIQARDFPADISTGNILDYLSSIPRKNSSKWPDFPKMAYKKLRPNCSVIDSV